MAADLFDCSGKVTLITGGNSGLGLGYARGIARQGGDLVIWGRSAEKLAAAKKELEAFGVRVSTAQVDAASEAEISAGIAAAIEDHGRLDCVIANAGISTPVPSVLDLTTEAYHELLGAAQHGVFYTLREGARHMVERAKAGDPGGSLIATGSLSIFLGLPGLQHYAAAKAAVAAMIRGFAYEFGKYGIRANVIAAGYIRTEIARDRDPALKAATDAHFAANTPMPRVGEPSDFEGIAAYLVSDASRFHTGDTIVIDGGYLISI
jgi:NAD(P)-dependent dehydrogenase (short-subunit alcohol dehydrogenase family)